MTHTSVSVKQGIHVKQHDQYSVSVKRCELYKRHFKAPGPVKAYDRYKRVCKAIIFCDLYKNHCESMRLLYNTQFNLLTSYNLVMFEFLLFTS